MARSENPYWQHFCGETFFHRDCPSSMTRWLGSARNCEWLSTETIGQAVRCSDRQRFKRVTVDTTVMEKNIAHPTDARLFGGTVKLVAIAREAGLGLRQSYSRLAPLCRSGSTPMPIQTDAQGVAQAQGLHWSGAAPSSGSWTRFRRAGAPGRDDCAGEPAAGSEAERQEKALQSHEPC